MLALIPKRFGDLGVQRIVNLYAGIGDVGVYHPSIVISVSKLLDVAIDRFNSGFYHITVYVRFW